MRINRDITRPGDMLDTERLVNELIDKLENEIVTTKKGEIYYHIVVDGEYPRTVCDIVQGLYMEYGWGDAICSTSSEKEERPGYTSLQLWVPKQMISN